MLFSNLEVLVSVVVLKHGHLLRLVSCLFPVLDSQPTATELFQSLPFGSGTVFRSTSHLRRHFPSSALAWRHTSSNCVINKTFVMPAKWHRHFGYVNRYTYLITWCRSWVLDPSLTYTVCKGLHEALTRPGPDLIICDEGHRIKNSHASISQALKNIRTKYVCLSVCLFLCVSLCMFCLRAY